MSDTCKNCDTKVYDSDIQEHPPCRNLPWSYMVYISTPKKPKPMTALDWTICFIILYSILFKLAKWIFV
jgi:hypothetical protein